MKLKPCLFGLPAGSLEWRGGIGSKVSVCAGCFRVHRPTVMMGVVMATLLIAHYL